MQHDHILIVDFGSQYTQLIARRVREAGVYCEIHPYHRVNKTILKKFKPKGIILSGGPPSVNPDEPYPEIPSRIFDLDVPILGICYGMQVLCDYFGATVKTADNQEFGDSKIDVSDASEPLFKFGDGRYIIGRLHVWMSHSDVVQNLGEYFDPLAKSSVGICAVKHKTKPYYGLQFHPEVTHTDEGQRILTNFVCDICGCSGDWTMASFKDEAIAAIREQVGDKKVICGVSGGIDSTVTAALLDEAIGDQLICVFVDNGLLRQGEADEVNHLFNTHFRAPFIHKNAQWIFLTAIKGVTDPEIVRKRIGKTFINVFESTVEELPFDVEFLAQGTLYPDVIESVSAFGGPSATIKSHHNVGGLPEVMNLKLIEPLRELFKDEVRELAKELDIPEEFIKRHPFPGPGLAIRVIGNVTEERLEILRQADQIFIEELHNNGYYDKVWQAFAVLLPIQSVGVMGDQRTYENVCALRAVTSTDGMTAKAATFPANFAERDSFLSRVATRIVNEVRGINRVVYDITSKPPGTIEWE